MKYTSIYPNAHDMLHRRHVIRRRDSFFCLQAVQAHRLLGDYETARQVLATAKRYEREARELGFKIPGGSQ